MISKILKIINDYHNDVMFDTEANHVEYRVEYFHDHVGIFEVDVYRRPGEDFGEVEQTSNAHKIAMMDNVELKDFTRMLIDYMEFEQEWRYRYGSVYDKIDFKCT